MIKQETPDVLNKRKVFCNHFMSAFKWFSGRNKASSYRSVYDALKAHLRYISGKREDLVAVWNADFEKWKELTEKELSKRWDARIACKFFVTLPNAMTDREALDLVKDFLEKEIRSQYFTITVHRNFGCIEGKENLHAHVIFYARNVNGKKISFSKSELYNLRRTWENYLENKGFTIKTAPWRGRIRVNLYQNSKLNELEVKYIKTQRQVWAWMTKAIDIEKSFREEKERKRREPIKREQKFPERKTLRDTLERILKGKLAEIKRRKEEQEEKEKKLKTKQNQTTLPRRPYPRRKP